MLSAKIIVTKKKVSKKAVHRNRVRRRIKAALRELGVTGSPVIRANREMLLMPWQELLEEIRRQVGA